MVRACSQACIVASADQQCQATAVARTDELTLRWPTFNISPFRDLRCRRRSRRTPQRCSNGQIAQLVEHGPEKAGVGGSSPHHKAKGLAVVTINGHDHYLGKYNSAASHEAYRRLVAEYLQTGNGPAAADQESITVVEVLAAYKRYRLCCLQQLRIPPGR